MNLKHYIVIVMLVVAMIGSFTLYAASAAQQNNQHTLELLWKGAIDDVILTHGFNPVAQRQILKYCQQYDPSATFCP